MYCRFCGQEIADESVYCAKCGKHLGSGAAPKDTVQNAAPVPNSKAKATVYVSSRQYTKIGAAVIAAVVLLGVLILAGQNKRISEKRPTERQSYTVTLDGMNGSANQTVTVLAKDPMPDAAKPTLHRQQFMGYYSEQDGKGTQYYDEEMNSVREWDIPTDGTLYAYWVDAPETVFSSQSHAGDCVYVDIKSIVPVYCEVDGHNIYLGKDLVCKATTSAGTTVWIFLAEDGEYTDNFDHSVGGFEIDQGYYSTATFSRALRVHGTVINPDDVWEGLSKKTAKLIIDFDYLG